MSYINGKGRQLFLSQAPTNYVGGTSGKETQTGTSRNDNFHGSGGDLLVGGQGDDTYTLWDRASTVVEAAGQGNDTIYVKFGGPFTLSANVENLVLAPTGSYSATGNALDNIIIAGATGATLDGQAGDDVLVGGAGADIFKVSAGNGSDAIMNFKPGFDAIVLNGYGVGTFAQVLKVAQQVGSDVVLKFGNGETLAIRDVKLSDLSAYDFGMSSPLAHPDGNIVMVGAGRAQTQDGWYIFNNVWNPGTLKYGTDFTIDSSYSRADLTGSTTFNWSFPLVTESYPAIRAYPEVIFGPAPMSGGGKATDIAGVFPIQLSSLVSLVADYDVSFQGNTGGFNVAYDIWFTNKPNGDKSTITTELMVWIHKGDFDAMGKVVATYQDGADTAKIYVAPGASGTYIAVVFDEDRPKGQLDIAKLVTYLQGLGLMSASEYLASIELGAEVVSGAGSLKINNLDFSVVASGENGSTTVYDVDGTGTTKTIVPAADTRLIYNPAQSALKASDGHDTLTLNQAAKVDLSNSTSQVDGPSRVTDFKHVDASGSTGAVTLIGSAADNTLTGGAFDDYIDGGAGRDSLHGGAGNDRIVYDRNDEIIDGGDGRDTLVLKQAATVNLGASGSQVSGGGAMVVGFEDVNASAASGPVTLTGSAGENTLTGSAFADVLDGGAGRDSLYGGAGDDRIVYDRNDYVIDGGAGWDTLVLKEAGTVNLGASGSQVAGGANVIGFENVDASAATAAVSLTGSQTGNTLTGSAFDDYIDGGAGRDYLYGGAGNDRIVYDKNDYVTDGGAGQDTLILKESATVDLNAFGKSQVQGGGYVLGFENVDASGSSGAVTVHGSDWNSTITGSAYADTLTGGARYDVIHGGAGDDYIDGGAGRDYLYGDAGNDRIVYDRNDYVTDGGAGQDTLILKESATVDLNAFGKSQVEGGGYVLGFENVDASGSSGAVTVYGSDWNSTITGSASADKLIGGARYDVIHGGAGDDYIDGGAGRDYLYGDAGNDRIVYDKNDYVIDGGAGQDTLILKEGATVDLNAFGKSQVEGGAYVLNFENVDASGANSAATLRGSQYNNTIVGTAFDDRIAGGGGYDVLTGGAGRDVFVFDGAPNGAYARITDFSAKDDKIVLDDQIFGLAIGGLKESAFHVGAAATSAEQRIIYNSSTGELFFDADGSGTGAQPIHFATLNGNPALNATHFSVA